MKSLWQTHNGLPSLEGLSLDEDKQQLNMAQVALNQMLLGEEGDEGEMQINNHHEPAQHIDVARILNGIRACSPFLTRAVQMHESDVMSSVDEMLNATRQLFNAVAKECLRQKIEVKDEQWGIVNALCIDFVANHWSAIDFNQPVWAALIVKLLTQQQLFVYRHPLAANIADTAALTIDIGVNTALLQALSSCIDIDKEGEATLQQLVMIVRNTAEVCMKRLARFHVPDEQEDLIRAEIIKHSAELLSAIITTDTTIVFARVIQQFETFMQVLTESIFVNSKLVK